MTIVEKAAYLKGLAEGLGIDPGTKEGKLWTALNELLSDMAHEISELRESGIAQAEALDDLADEVACLSSLGDGDLMPPPPPCGGCRQGPGPDAGDFEPEELYDEEDGFSYDGIVYDATCPSCGREFSFDEDALAEGSIRCPGCGEILEFDLDADADGEEAGEPGDIPL